MKSHILVAAVCAVLVGCRFAMPAFDSGKLERHVMVNGRDSVTTTVLSQSQLNALAEWFSAHQSGWKKNYADVGPEKFVHLSRGGAAVAYFNLSGNVLYAASYSRVLTPGELQALEKILEEGKG